jgi:hypothetical protein
MTALTIVLLWGNQIQIEKVEVKSINDLTSTKAKIVVINTMVCNVEDLEFSICDANGALETVEGRINENIVEFAEQSSNKVLIRLVVSKAGNKLNFIKATKVPNVAYVKDRNNLVLVTENGVARWK